jgi:hypothetical protein
LGAWYGARLRNARVLLGVDSSQFRRYRVVTVTVTVAVRKAKQHARSMSFRSQEPLEDPTEVESAWDEEIARRVEEVRNGAAKLIPLVDVERRLIEIVRQSRTR